MSVPLYRVLDTRSGTGEATASQLGAGQSLTVTVTGVDTIPSDATSVVTNVVALNATASGYLTTWDSDIADPNVATVGVKAGINTNQTDTIGVSANGTVSVANHSSAALDVVMTVMGYYTGTLDDTAGDTYGDAGWQKIVDTSAGLGAPQAPIPAGGSITVQVGGQGGVPTGADTAVLQFSANNATTNGYLTAYPAGTSDPGISMLLYDSSMTFRDIEYVPLSSSGQITVTNHGTASVNLVLYTRGYFMPPAATTVGGEYVPVGPDGPALVYGAGGGATVAANSSVTFQVAGAAGLPQTGVVEVAEHVIVTDPTQSGFLDAYRADGTDPNHATMNFLAGDDTDVGYQDSILSQISPTGQETISNHSSGAVTVQVAVVGMFYTPMVPPVPTYLQAAPTYTTTPVLSGVVQDASGDSPFGEIFLFDSAGNPIGGAPTAVGQVSTGERVSWPVTDGTLTNGSTYQWYMETCDQGVCSAPSATQVFTINTANAPTDPTATATATLTGAQVTGSDAIADSGACSGSDCPLTSNGLLKVGSDGTNNWASSLKFDTSSIPTGSTIVSATLTLTEAGCLTGTSCTTSAIDLYEPYSDVATDGTGPALAADALSDSIPATSPATQGAWDITNLMQDWVGGDTNGGIVIQAPTAGTAGLSYYSPTATTGSSNLPQVTVQYIPPAVPTAPSGLTVTPGDGGALVNWSAPSNWGYLDTSYSATFNYTVKALSGSTVVASATTSDTKAELSGLADGTAYTFQVTATNPIGTSSAVTSTQTPTAVTGGTSEYVTAVSQFLNAQDTLTTGQATTATRALNGDNMSASDIGQLSEENLDDSPTAVLMAAHQEQDTADTTALSNTVVYSSASGTVSIYTTADETYTTVDTSSGSAVSVPSEDTTDYLFTYGISSGTPILTGYVDADSALAPIGASENPTATSAVLDPPPQTGGPDPIAMDANDNFIDGTDTSNNPPCVDWPNGGRHGGYLCPNRVNEVSWAVNKVYTAGDDGFGDDCTDFVSRALNIPDAGHLKQVVPSDGAVANPFNQHNDHFWYRRPRPAGEFNSLSWSVAGRLYNFFSNEGAHFVKYGSYLKTGYLLFANWRNKDDTNPSSGSDSINHVGIISRITGKNIFITQHTHDRQYDPLFRVVGHVSWYGYAPHLQLWGAVPARKA